MILEADFGDDPLWGDRSGWHIRGSLLCKKKRFVKSVCIRSYSIPYSVRMRENAEQNNSQYGHFLRSEVAAHFNYNSTKGNKIPLHNINLPYFSVLVCFFQLYQEWLFYLIQDFKSSSRLFPRKLFEWAWTLIYVSNNVSI